jgi:hypothetical protein
VLNIRKGCFPQNIMKTVCRYAFHLVRSAPLLGLNWLGLESDQSSASGA